MSEYLNNNGFSGYGGYGGNAYANNSAETAGSVACASPETIGNTACIFSGGDSGSSFSGCGSSGDSGSGGGCIGLA